MAARTGELGYDQQLLVLSYFAFELLLDGLCELVRLTLVHRCYKLK